MTHADRIRACHGCPHRQPTCNGACPCTIDGKDILEHAKGGDCPEGRYAKGLGDRVESIIDAVTFGQGKSLAQAFAKAVGAKDCGCAGRKEALNRLGEKLGLG